MLVSGGNAVIQIPANTTLTISGARMVVDQPKLLFQGSGWSSIIKARDSASMTQMIYVTAAGSGAQFFDLAVDGNRTNTGTVNLLGNLFHIGTNDGTGGVTDLKIVNCEIHHGMNFGIYASDKNARLEFRNNYIHDNGGTVSASDGGVGIVITRTSPDDYTTDVSVIGNTIINNYPTLAAATFGGGLFLTSHSTVVVGNYLLNNYNNGAQVAVNQGVIASNHIEKTTDKSGGDSTSGIESSSASLVMSGNSIVGHSAAGIALQGDPAAVGTIGGSDISITGNFIFNKATNGDCISATNAGGKVRAVSITGNRLKGCTRGLFVDTASEGIVATGNEMTDNTTPVVDNSTYGTMLENNSPWAANLIYRGSIAAANTISNIRCGEVITLSGGTTVKTLTPYTYAASTAGPGCRVTLIPAAASTWVTDTTGNIALASTAVPLKALIMTYDGSAWSPSY
jgi:hypothetical protein